MCPGDFTIASITRPQDMFVNVIICFLWELLKKYVYNFRNRLETSDNVNIRGICLSHFPLQSGIWDWWRDILSL